MTAIKWKSGVKGDWATAADWSTETVPGAADDVTIDVAGKFTVTINSAEAAHSLTLNNTTATVADNSTLMIGSMPSLSAGTFQLNSAGVVSGGTINSTGGVFQINGGALNGVTFDGTLNLALNYAYLHVGGGGLITNGVGGVGKGTVNITGKYSEIIFAGTQTFDNATVSLGGNDYIDQTGTGTLTLGVNLAVNQTSSGVGGGIIGGTIVNQGVINANAGGKFRIGASSVTNLGTISAGRPAPGRRTFPANDPGSPSSARPRPIVLRATPVARDTAAIPP
jgi:hypothetical protein